MLGYAKRLLCISKNSHKTEFVDSLCLIKGQACSKLKMCFAKLKNEEDF